MELSDPSDLLQSLVYAYGPCGQEDEIRSLCKKHLEKIADATWIDEADNVIGKIAGEDSSLGSIRVMVHMDELSLIVKRINEDGSLRVNPLGGIWPFNFGQGPVDVLGDEKTCPGVLSFGCMHTTKESAGINKFIPEEHRGLGKSLGWEDVFVVTRLSPDESKEAGIHPGTRVVISRSRRQLHKVNDCIAGYFLDNRAAIAIALHAFKQLRERGIKPKRDIYFVATGSEEVGAHGATFAARSLPGEITLAIDVGPVAKEYQTQLNASPIVVYQDAFALYDKKICDQLMKLGNGLGLAPQSAIWGSYGSDASLAYSRGHAAKAVLICFPVENTHGYEIAHKDSLRQCSMLLEAFLSV